MPYVESAQRTREAAAAARVVLMREGVGRTTMRARRMHGPPPSRLTSWCGCVDAVRRGTRSAGRAHPLGRSACESA
ncbi:hypothetical protein HNP40_003879 [Mycobacteroides chelonae]|nr:hypothetical protein [Mycobacteroides chelonae]